MIVDVKAIVKYLMAFFGGFMGTIAARGDTGWKDVAWAAGFGAYAVWMLAKTSPVNQAVVDSAKANQVIVS